MDPTFVNLARYNTTAALFIAIIVGPVLSRAQSNAAFCDSISDVKARDRCHSDFHGSALAAEGQTQAQSLTELQDQAIQRQTDDDKTQAIYARLMEKNARALEAFVLAGYHAVARQGVAFASTENSLSELQAVTLLAGPAFAAPAPMQVDYLDQHHNVGKLTNRDGVVYYLKPKASSDDIEIRGKMTEASSEQPCRYTVTLHYLLGDEDRDYACDTFAGGSGLNGIREQIEEAARKLLTPPESSN